MDEQNWPAYNEAQTCEKLMFLDILGELCSFVPPASNGHVGRPKADIRDMVFSCVSKVYEGMSSRRVISDLELLKNKGCIGKTPHFNTITKYFKDPALTHILFNLLRISALPLKDLETTFAVDASGLSSAFYSRWFVQRFVKGVPEELKVHDWLKSISSAAPRRI